MKNIPEKKTENRFIKFFRRNRNVFLPFKYFIYLVGIIVIILFIIETSFSTLMKEWSSSREWQADPRMLTEHYYHPLLDYTGPYTDTKNPCKLESENPLQVYMYGGSTMVDFIGNYYETIPSHVSMLLCKKGIPVEIKNFGQIGYTSTQEVIHFLLSLKEEQAPDIVIFYDGYNDSIGAFRGLPEVVPLISKQVFNYYVDLTESRFELAQQKYLGQLFSGIYSFRDSKRPEEIEKSLNFFEHSPFFYPVMTDRYENMLNSYLRNVRIIKSTEETWDFKSFFYWQPHIVHKIDSLSEEEKKIFRKYSVSHSHLLLNDSATDDIITEFLNDTGEVKDLRALFADNPDMIFVDQCHINSQGNKIIAEKIVGDILKYLEESGYYEKK